MHSIHHEYRAPFCWVTQHEHILELLPVAIWSVMVPVGLRCHPLTQWLFMLGATQFSIEAHCGYNYGIGACVGYCLGPRTLGETCGLASWAVHHDRHHRFPSRNFEPFFTYLDRLCGSLHVEPTKAAALEGATKAE